MKLNKIAAGAMLFVVIWLFTNPLAAKPLIIAAASDLKYAMDEVIIAFHQQYSEREINVVYGSSGKLRTQIEYGAPFDVYFSADIRYPQYLYDKGFASSKVVPYALGRLVLWSNTEDISKVNLRSLTQAHYLKIAIANPKHAPYGIRAKQVLENLNLWETLKTKIVYAESVSHAAQYVKTQHADVGFIALSLVLSEPLSNGLGYQLIPESLHQPLVQGFIITQHGSKHSSAKIFANFVQSTQAKALLAKYGFTEPVNNE